MCVICFPQQVELSQVSNYKAISDNWHFEPPESFLTQQNMYQHEHEHIQLKSPVHNIDSDRVTLVL